jgi:dihydropyrimidinase
MGIVITGGTLVTASETLRLDLRLDGDRIDALGLDLVRPGDEVVDATGRLVMPGGIDPHVHFSLPAGGTRSTDDFESGTIAAAWGGTTTVIDFVTPSRGQPLAKALSARLAEAEGRAAIDYGLHMTLVEAGRSMFDQASEMMRAGLTSFKVYTAYPSVMLSDRDLYDVLVWSGRAGVRVLAHCENGPVIDRIAADMVAEGRIAPRFHATSRPSILEGEATERVLSIAAAAGAPVYVVHVTCREAVAAVARTRSRGQRVDAETCPHYLHLDDKRLLAPGFDGAKYVCSPPLRGPGHAEALWRGLADGTLGVVSTDHCPFDFPEDKELGRDDFRLIPGGLPGVETRLTLAWQGVVDGWFGVNRFVDLVAATPARLFGLYPRKGTLAPGSDADVVVWDQDRIVDLSAASLHMRVNYSPYEKLKAPGGPAMVFARGRKIVDGERFLGRAGEGRFLKRDTVG